MSRDENNINDSDFKEKQCSYLRNLKYALLFESCSDENTCAFIFIIDNDNDTTNKNMFVTLTSWVEQLSSLG